jgi:hypothetical protein
MKLFADAQFQFQQIMSGLGGADFDNFHMNLYTPTAPTHFGERACKVTLQRGKRSILANVVLDWREYSQATSDDQRIRISLAAWADAAEIVLRRLGHNDLIERYRDRIADVESTILA